MVPGAVSLTQDVELLGVGLLAGVLGGLLGIGGGVIMIPALVVFLGADAFGPNSFHAYKLAAISTSLILSIPAVIRHTRARAVVYPMLPGILPLAALGVVLGVLLSGLFVNEQTATLRRVFGGFLELIVLNFIHQEHRARRGLATMCDACPLPRRRMRIGLLVGLPAGIIAGLLGVGGGVWAVPAQRQLLGITLRSAIANSAFAIICIAATTSAALSIQLHRLADPGVHPVQGWRLAAWLAPGALLGGWLGAGLTHRIPVRWLRYAFLALLTVTGLRLMLS